MGKKTQRGENAEMGKVRQTRRLPLSPQSNFESFHIVSFPAFWRVAPMMPDSYDLSQSPRHNRAMAEVNQRPEGHLPQPAA